MSYNGSGTFQINTSGQPVVAGTVISSTAFNALTADLATGLSTAITKDGQTTTTARIPFAAGINSSLVTDSSSTTTGSIITAGGVGIAKALYVGTTANVAGAATLGSTLTYGGVTLTNAVTGTGKMVLDTSPTLVTPVLGAASATSVTVAAGAVGTPSITTTGDTNTGIFFPAADTIAFAEGGVEAMRISSAGNVGIGTSSPSSPLNVVSASSSLAIAINGRSSDSLGAMYFYANNGSTQHATIITSATEFRFSSVPAAAVQTFYTNGAERMRLTSDGNLQFNSGYGSVATAYGCRAWVNFDGTGTPAIRASGNVSSITDVGVGLYDVNFTTAMPDANYAIAATAYSANSSLYAVGGQTNGQAPATTKFRVATGAGASLGTDTTAGYADLPYIFASVFR